MAATAEERIPALTSADIFSLAVPFAAIASERRIGANAARGQKPHQRIFSRNRTIAVGATWAKWPGTHQVSGQWWSETVLGIVIDANGNTLSDPSGKSYSWDFENRLTQVVNPGVGTITFRYDPWGRRIQKSGPNGTTNFVYDESNTIEELDGVGNVLARYTQGKGIDEPLGELRAGIPSYYESDGLGSVTSLTNASATIAATYGYDAFGNLLVSTGSVTNPFRYTAREADTETGLYYYRARFYDPTVGRFLSGDQIGNDEGSNLYTYVRNAPIQFRDPTGLYTLHGFGPQREQQMRDAIQSAIDTLEKKNKDCKDGCAGSLGPKIVQALQNADYVFVSYLQSNGTEDCANARPLPSRIIHVGWAAFDHVKCCRLDATLAHEATHKATQSNDEKVPENVEEQCFGCH